MSLDFSSIRALSFDLYGTLIDWEAGILPTLYPLTSQLPSDHACHPSSSSHHRSAISAFHVHEAHFIAAKPKALYEELLADSYKALAKEWNLDANEADAENVGASIGEWKAFPDTVQAMQTLGRHFKLIALSNISISAYAKTKNGPLNDVHFDAAYLAEEIGSYKPDHRNFDFLLKGVSEDLGVKKEELLHVAHGVSSDQTPCAEMGIKHCWIARGGDNIGQWDRAEKLVEYDMLGDLAADVEKDLGAK